MTSKDINILRYIACGLTTKEIAHKLFIKKRDVDYRLRELRIEFNARNTTHLIAITKSIKLPEWKK